MIEHPAPPDVTSRMIELIASGQYGPQDLAEALGLSLTELAQQFASSRAARTLCALAAMSELRAQLYLIEARTAAASRLARIAAGELESNRSLSDEDHPVEHKPGDLQRKACVDLLRTNVGLPESLRLAASGDEEDGPAVSEEAILEVLGSIGKKRDEAMGERGSPARE